MRTASLASAVILSAAALAVLASPPALRWTVDTSRPAPAEWVLLRGEARLLEPVLQEARMPVAWPSNTVATLYWQTNGMGSAWWTAPASLGTSTGQLSAVWSATNDVGAASYSYFLGAQVPESGRVYSAHGTIRYRHAPGAEPNALPLPVQTIDFSLVEILNPLWATPGDLDASRAAAELYAAAAAAQALTNAIAAVDAVSLAGLAAKDDRAASLQILADVGNKSAPTNGVITASGRGDLDTPSISFGSGVWVLGEFSPQWSYWAMRGDRAEEVWPGPTPLLEFDADRWYFIEAWNWVPGFAYDEAYLYVGPSALDPSGVYEALPAGLPDVTLSWTGTLPAGPREYRPVASVPYVDALLPTWPSIDIVTGKNFTVVVSNEHWLIVYPPETP